MFRDAQKQVDDWVQTFATPYWEPLSEMAALTEEVGEVARLMNHIYGGKPKKPEEARQELGLELADVLFATICLANSHDIDLDEEFQKMMDKNQGRDSDRFKKKAT